MHQNDLVSAAEIADILGVSLKTLGKLDESGELRALRRENGRRYYTSAHITAALELAGGAEGRETCVKFRKRGAAALRGGVELPTRWLAWLGITEESPEASIVCDGEKIVITKPKEK